MPVALYMAAIFTLSSLSTTPNLPHGTDKEVHAVLYFGLGALLVRALAGGWRAHVSLWTALAAIVIAALYGITDEVHQHFVPSRQMDTMDAVADTLGAAAAALVLLVRGRGV